MGNVGRVFLRDLKRLAKAPAAWLVVLFLTLLPSLYTWFNVAAFWNPYDNTGNLRVCVVNEDAGIVDETLGELDLGAQVVAELKGEDRLGWVFVSREEAMDEVGSGRAYAAFLIPADFSADVATITTGEFQQPVLEYYVNEKAGPVVPKITDTGANTLDTSINDAFFSTVSSTVAGMLGERLDEAELKLQSSKSEASSHVQRAIDDVAEARASLASLSAAAEEARSKAESAKGMIDGAKTGVDELSDDLGRTSQALADMNQGLAQFSAAMGSALDEGSAGMTKVSAQTNLAIAQTTSTIEMAKAAVGAASDKLSVVEPDYDELIGRLEAIRELLPNDQLKTRVDEVISTLRSAQKASRDWDELVKSLDDAAASAQAAGELVGNSTAGALATADAYRGRYSSEVAPSLASDLGQISAVAGSFGGAVAGQKVALDQASIVLDQLQSTLTLSEEALEQTDSILAMLGDSLQAMQADLDMLGTSDALSQLLGNDGVDPDKVADFMMSPTRIQPQQLYAVDAYGSAMAPLFMNLTLWIGVFMLMVIIRLEVDDAGIPRLTIAQRTLGRGVLLSIIATLQAVVCCTGCIMLGVQTASVPLFYLTAIVAALAYLAVQYVLSSTLQHVGKAICIILVFVQIPGATGLYPIEMTPEFFRAVYPLFPFTYGINAIRETICGFYGNAWAVNIAVLVAFMAGFMVAGIVARPYLANLNRMFAREIAESDIINGEAIELPARRYRLAQIVDALSNRSEYRAAIDARARAFMARYPLMKRGALAAGIAVPVAATAVMGLLNVDKVVVLTSWLAWLAVVVGFLIVVEYLRDHMSHLVSLESMSDEEIHEAYAGRNTFTRVRPIAKAAGPNAHVPAAGDPGADERKGLGDA